MTFNKVKVNEKVRNNPIVMKIWKGKSYFDIANSQTGWVTGKFVDIMGVLFVFEKVGIVIEGVTLIIAISIVLFLMIGFGMIFKKAGLYDSQVEATTHLNVVQSEMYQAAKKINRGK